MQIPTDRKINSGVGAEETRPPNPRTNVSIGIINLTPPPRFRNRANSALRCKSPTDSLEIPGLPNP